MTAVDVRIKRTGTIAAMTVLLLVSSCSGRFVSMIPEGVPPPSGDAIPEVNTRLVGRPADQLHDWAAPRARALNMPVTALEAYAYAAKVAEVENPDCHLRWTTLAAIGTVESANGTYRGATVAPNGDVRPPIRGVPLDGTRGNLRILEDASTIARAMGPMQFIPETWRRYKIDAHNNGVADVDNIDDAALAAAGYLCYTGGDLATPTGWLKALRAYNDSEVYARSVRDWATAYASGRAP